MSKERQEFSFGNINVIDKGGKKEGKVGEFVEDIKEEAKLRERETMQRKKELELEEGKTQEDDLESVEKETAEDNPIADGESGDFEELAEKVETEKDLKVRKQERREIGVARKPEGKLSKKELEKRRTMEKKEAAKLAEMDQEEEIMESPAEPVMEAAAEQETKEEDKKKIESLSLTITKKREAIDYLDESLKKEKKEEKKEEIKEKIKRLSSEVEEYNKELAKLKGEVVKETGEMETIEEDIESELREAREKAEALKDITDEKIKKAREEQVRENIPNAEAMAESFKKQEPTAKVLEGEEIPSAEGGEEVPTVEKEEPKISREVLERLEKADDSLDKVGKTKEAFRGRRDINIGKAGAAQESGDEREQLNVSVSMELGNVVAADMEFTETQLELEKIETRLRGGEITSEERRDLEKKAFKIKERRREILIEEERHINNLLGKERAALTHLERNAKEAEKKISGEKRSVLNKITLGLLGGKAPEVTETAAEAGIETPVTEGTEAVAEPAAIMPERSWLWKKRHPNKWKKEEKLGRAYEKIAKANISDLSGVAENCAREIMFSKETNNFFAEFKGYLDRWSRGESLVSYQREKDFDRLAARLEILRNSGKISPESMAMADAFFNRAKDVCLETVAPPLSAERGTENDSRRLFRSPETISAVGEGKMEQPEPMNMYALPGHKIIITQEMADSMSEEKKEEIKNRGLEIGKVYTVEKTEVGSSYTRVHLKEIPGRDFNHIYFSDVEEQDLESDKQHPDWAKWNQIETPASEGEGVEDENVKQKAFYIGENAFTKQKMAEIDSWLNTLKNEKIRDSLEPLLYFESETRPETATQEWRDSFLNSEMGRQAMTKYATDYETLRSNIAEAIKSGDAKIISSSLNDLKVGDIIEIPGKSGVATCVFSGTNKERNAFYFHRLEIGMEFRSATAIKDDTGNSKVRKIEFIERTKSDKETRGRNKEEIIKNLLNSFDKKDLEKIRKEIESNKDEIGFFLEIKLSALKDYSPKLYEEHVKEKMDEMKATLNNEDIEILENVTLGDVKKVLKSIV